MLKKLISIHVTELYDAQRSTAVVVPERPVVQGERHTYERPARTYTYVTICALHEGEHARARTRSRSRSRPHACMHTGQPRPQLCA